MKSKLNITFACLCLGLFACGTNTTKDRMETPTALVEADLPAAKVSDLQATSDQIIGAISQTKAALAATQDPARRDELNAQLKDLKAQYAKNAEALSDAEGYQLLLKFVIEHQVTALDQLPAKFAEAKADEQKKLEEIKGQESSFLTKIEASVDQMTEAKAVLKNVDRTLRARAGALQAKSELTAAEQQQLRSIQSYLDSAAQLISQRTILSKAQAEVRVHEDAVAGNQKKRTQLSTQKTDLIRQLLQVPADDMAAREQILAKIERIQDQIIDIDVMIYDHKTALGKSQDQVSASKLSIDSLKSTIESVVPGLADISGADVALAMKNAEAADQQFQALQTDYQVWRNDVQKAEMTLVEIGRLEAFFAQKYPDIQPTPPS